jgi:hypothetical protein
MGYFTGQGKNLFSVDWKTTLYHLEVFSPFLSGSQNIDAFVVMEPKNAPF